MLDLQEGQRKIIANQDGMKERLDKIENDFANLRDEVSCLRNDQKANTVAIRDLEGATDWISHNLKELRFELDRQEQYSRKSPFRIFGVSEKDQENIEDVTMKVIKDELEIEIKKEEIDIVHRTGSSRNGKPRPILVKYNRLSLNVMKWLKGNKLSLNVMKTLAMLISTKPKHKTLMNQGKSLKLKIRNDELEVVQKTKYLGVQIDNKLDWKEHIKSVSSKVSRA